MTEATLCSCYLSARQRHAKRFDNAVAAYRVALRWGNEDWRVVRLKLKKNRACA